MSFTINIDWVVEQTYRDAKLDPAQPQGAAALAKGLFGKKACRYAPAAMLAGATAKLAQAEDGPPQILLARGKTPEEKNESIGHEMGEFKLGELAYEEPDCEHWASVIGRALIMPREALREFNRLQRGFKPEIVAQQFVVSPRAALLRYAEMSGCPLAIVSPAGVALSGREWGWPTSDELRRIAKGRFHREFERHALDASSVALLAKTP